MINVKKIVHNKIEIPEAECHLIKNMLLKPIKILLIIVAGSLFLMTSVSAVLSNKETLPYLKTAAEQTGITKTALPPDVSSALGFWTKQALALVGLIFFIIMIYAGFCWMTAQGEDEAVKKAQKTISMAAIGLIIIVSSYALTQFVTGRVIDKSAVAPLKDKLINEGPLGCCVDWLPNAGMIQINTNKACYVSTEANCKLQGEDPADGQACHGPAENCWQWYYDKNYEDASMKYQDACVQKYCS